MAPENNPKVVTTVATVAVTAVAAAVVTVVAIAVPTTVTDFHFPTSHTNHFT